MCMVSFMTTPTTTPQWPHITPFVIPQKDLPWTRDTWQEFQQILDMLKKLDEKLGAKDCEDPEKAKWMLEVDERLRRLEHGSEAGVAKAAPTR